MTLRSGNQRSLALFTAHRHLTSQVAAGIVIVTLLLGPASLLRADFPTVTLFKNGAEGYNNFRIPALVQAANGDLLAFCEARSGGDASEIDLVLKRSVDGGKTWQKIEMVQDRRDFRSLYPENAPPITIGNPAPVVDLLDPEHPGRIWLPFTLENDRVFVTYSDDYGVTWVPRREITQTVKKPGWGWYATGPGHAIQLQQGPHRGRLVIPADHRLGEGGQDKGLEGAHALLSDDHGQTWRLGALDDTYDDDLKANETTAVELTDGRLYFNTRDQNGKAAGTRGGAYSSDGGVTFDRSQNAKYHYFVPVLDPLDLPVVEGSLLRAAARTGGDRLDMILFSGPDENGPSGAGRSDMRLRYSLDETATWQDGPLVHEGPAAYSDLARISSNHFGILFEAGAKGQKNYDEIRFARFTLDDLKLPESIPATNEIDR